MNFHRPQRLLVAMVRRWLAILFSMYFDNACFQDLSNVRGKAPRQINGLFKMAGMPLQREKGVDLRGCNDFMGLTHHMAKAIPEGENRIHP